MSFVKMCGNYYLTIISESLSCKSLCDSVSLFGSDIFVWVKGLDIMNSFIPLMQKQLAEIHQSINNLVKAMEMGIVSRETKQRFEELEAQRTELETDIIKQEIQEEIITREQVVEWLKEMKRLDLSLDDSKRKLVDTFVNSVYLYDDKVVIIFNCRESGCKRMILPFLFFRENCQRLNRHLIM